MPSRVPPSSDSSSPTLRAEHRRSVLLTLAACAGLVVPVGLPWANSHAVAASASAERLPHTVTLQIRGEIRPSLLPEVKKALAQTNGDPLPAGLLVLLDSQGGDGLVAAEVGRLLRQADAHVFVTGRCASACVFILMGGVVREAPDGALGVHRARLTRLDEKTGKRIEIDTTRSDRAARRLREGNATLQRYLRDMGVLDAFYALMEVTPVESMRWLSRAEARSLGVVGIEPEYLSRREAHLMRRYQIRQGDLERNTASVLSRCLGEAKAASPDKFVQCYRLTLDRP